MFYAFVASVFIIMYVNIFSKKLFKTTKVLFAIEKTMFE